MADTSCFYVYVYVYFVCNLGMGFTDVLCADDSFFFYYIVAGVKRLLMKLKSREIYSGTATTLFRLPNAQIRL